MKLVQPRHKRLAAATGLILLLLATRLPHFAGPIDDPHSWRQCDTAHYALDFHENGIDLLRPSVCWMGTYGTVVLEFPLPEALMALLYDVFGAHLVLPRLLTLLFFAASALYLFKILQRLFDGWVALAGTAVYIVLPLGIFYSRAVHVDFFAVALSHAMLYHLMRAYAAWSWKHAVAGAVSGALAFLIKAPYAFYFALPLAVVVLSKRIPRRILMLAGVFAVCAVLFIVWRIHADHVNSQAPDWSFIPDYEPLGSRSDWYFGRLHQRWSAEGWGILWDRLRRDVAGVVGVVLVMAGFALSLSGKRLRATGFRFVYAWLAGVVVYTVVFFPLNVIHDYYQIPLLAPVSALIGTGLVLLGRWIRGRESEGLPGPGLRRASAAGIPVLLFVALAADSITHAEASYYTIDEARIEIGRVIRRETPEESVVVVVVGSDWSVFQDPRILFRAGRRGWMFTRNRLAPGVVERFRENGATHVAAVVPYPEGLDRSIGHPGRRFELRHHRWDLFLYDVTRPGGR